MKIKWIYHTYRKCQCLWWCLHFMQNFTLLFFTLTGKGVPKEGEHFVFYQTPLRPPTQGKSFFWKQIFQEIWSTQGETNFTFGPIEKPLFSIPSAWARRALSVWGVFLHITLIPGLVWVESLNQGQGRTHINFDQNTWPCMDESTQIPISAFKQRFCQFQNLPVTLQIIIRDDIQ